MEIIKISRENWEISYEKWRLLVKFAKQQIRFHTRYGFVNLEVVGGCGYCKEVNFNCFKCKLYAERVCCSADYADKAGINRQEIPYLRYVREMRRSLPKGDAQKLVEIDWVSVLRDSIMMRIVISRDEPPKR